MKLFEIFGTVKVDTGPAEASLANVDGKGKEVGRTLDDLSNKTVGLADKMGAMGKKLTKFGGEMTKKVTLPIMAAGTASFMFAADLEDAMGASDQVFKGSSKEIKDWADNLETYYGIAEGEALEYANTMGSMLKNIGGLSEAEAAKQSGILIELAGDLTAMFGGTTESAVQALTNALKGNNSMLDNYGMGINDATIKTKALEMGLMEASASSADLTKANLDIEKAQIKYNEALKEHGSQSIEARDASNKLDLAKQKLNDSSEKVTGTMSLETKQAATLALIMEQTGDAQGQAAREADGASGSMRTLITELKNLATELGEVLLPIITPFISKLADMMAKFGEMSPATQKMIVALGFIAAAIGPLILIIGNVITAVSTIMNAFTLLGPALGLAGKAFALLTGPIGLVIAAIAGIIAVGVALYKNWDKIKEFGGKLKDGLVNTWNKLAESTKEAFGNIKSFGSDMVEGLKTRWNSLSDESKETFKRMAKNMLFPITGLYDSIKKIVEKIKKAFKFEIKFPKIKAPKWLAKVIPSLDDDYDGPEANPAGSTGRAGRPKVGKRFFAKGGYMNRATEFARVGGVSHIGGEAGGEGIVPLEGKHMIPFANYVAKVIKGNGGSEIQAANFLAKVIKNKGAGLGTQAKNELAKITKNSFGGGGPQAAVHLDKVIKNSVGGRTKATNLSDRNMKSSAGGGTQVKNEFNISSLVVREEADVRRIAEELEALTARKNRLRGAY